MTENYSPFFLKDYKDILHQYHPLDKKVWVDRFIHFWKPDALIMIESEVWPNFIMRAKKMSIPVIMASAQISNKSFKRMTKISKQSTKFLFDQIDISAMLASMSNNDTELVSINGGSSSQLLLKDNGSIVETITLDNVTFDELYGADSSGVIANDVLQKMIDDNLLIVS